MASCSASTPNGAGADRRDRDDPDDDHDKDHEEEDAEGAEEQGRWLFKLNELTFTYAVLGQVVMPGGSSAPVPRW